MKGKRNCRVTEVPLAVKSLNQGDVFILDTADKIFVWNGPYSNQAEKTKASKTIFLTARSMALRGPARNGLESRPLRTGPRRAFYLDI